ncbi:oxidoreductase C-terminal domain-containing protein [Streptomyces sp. NPDC046931]|uniref:oxidoreductase C-terminal domain-containing protein n=1 Tax=Streptomyces sp. NPDC046931 TaxID=3154806 RepID=UPI00340E9C57
MRSLPCFWSDQYGVRLQSAGRRHTTDTVRIAEGALKDGAPVEGGLLPVYERDGRTTAVLSFDRPRPFMRIRRELARAVEPVGPTAS